MAISRRVSWFGLLLSLFAVSACVDPDAKLDDFLGRIPDAAPEPDAENLSSIPDISGRFLLAMASVVDVERPMLFIVENTLTPQLDGTATLTSELRQLNYLTLQEAANAEPILNDDVAVAVTGRFTLSSPTVNVVAAANPVTGTDLTVSDAAFLGRIRSADVWCGDMTGMVTSPLVLDLAGSTFGAIRVAPGAIGDELPEPIRFCPPDANADAGVPDAGTPDA